MNQENFSYEMIEKLIENTSEMPVMYIALGSEPKRGHPYNLYSDIMNQPEHIQKTIEVNNDKLKNIAKKIILDSRAEKWICKEKSRKVTFTEKTARAKNPAKPIC